MSGGDLQACDAKSQHKLTNFNRAIRRSLLVMQF
jgi:hypothetical protein